MSSKAISWAWRQTGLSPVEKCVLMALADFHSDSAGCFPSLKSICERANTSKSTTLRALVELGRRNLIEKEIRQGKSANKISNNYRLSGFNLTPPPSVTVTPPPSVNLEPPTPSVNLTPPSVTMTPYRKNKKLTNTDTTYLSDPLLDFVNTVAPEPEISEEPPFDPVKFFWDEALRKLRNMAVPDLKSRKMIGKWLRDSGDDRGRVMAAIDEAVAKGTMEPISFVTKILDNKTLTPHKGHKHREWNDALEWLKTKSDERKAKGGSDDPRGSDRDGHGGVSDVERTKPPKVRRNGRSGSRTLPATDARETGGPVQGDTIQGQVYPVDSGIDF